MLVTKKFLLILFCAVWYCFTPTQLNAQTSPGTGQKNFGRTGFDFQDYDIYSMLNVNGQFALSQIPNNDPTLFTDDISNLGDALLLVSRTTTNGVRDVIVVVSGFGPFPGVPNNQSPVVAQELADLLEQEGIESQVVIIDVLWGEPDDRIDQVITDIACEHPDPSFTFLNHRHPEKFLSLPLVSLTCYSDRIPIQMATGEITLKTPSHSIQT
jgi:hypothetical protein